jgi:endonuclease/exonuclease/phosphatase family metal-dependent hydrolase
VRWGAPVLAGLLLVAWVLSVSRAGRRVEGCGDCRAEAAAAPGRDGLVVLSINVLHGFPRFEDLRERLDLVAAEIVRQDADIVLLQEVPWTPGLGNAAEYLAGRTGLNYLYLRANGNRRAILFEEGEAILSRYPLRDPALVELEPQAGFFEHRVVLGATAVTPWGDVRVFVTHLSHGKPEINRRQAAALQALVESAGRGPAMVAGDLNATEDSPQIQALARDWIDVYRSANPGDAGATCCVDDLAAEGAGLKKRIDYLFLVPGEGEPMRVESSRVVLDEPVWMGDRWLWASDHAGVVAVVTHKDRE